MLDKLCKIFCVKLAVAVHTYSTTVFVYVSYRGDDYESVTRSGYVDVFEGLEQIKNSHQLSFFSFATLSRW